MESIKEYLEVLELQDELVSLNEFELKDLVSKLTPEAKAKSLAKDIQSSLNKRDPINSLNRVGKLTNFLPKIEPRKIDSFMKSKTSDFMKFKKMSDVVLSNSISELSDNSKNVASSFLALTAFVVPKGQEKEDPKKNLKKNIKEFVFRVRKFMDEQEDKVKSGGFQKEDLPDLAVAWVIITMATATAVGLGAGGYVLMAAIAASIKTVLIVAVVFGIIASAGIYILGKRG